MKPKKGLSSILKVAADKAKRQDVYSNKPKEDKPKEDKPKEVVVSKDDNLTFKQKKQKLKQKAKLNKLESKANMTDADKKKRRGDLGKNVLGIIGGVTTASTAYSKIKKNLKE